MAKVVKMMKPIKEKISLTLDIDVIHQIKALAEADDRSVSQYINIVLREHLEKVETIKI